MKSAPLAFLKILSCFIILIFVGCKNAGEKNQQSTFASKRSENEEASKKHSFPIDFIIKHSRKRKVKYEIKELTTGNLRQITPAFFQTYLDNHPLKSKKNKKLNFDKYARYFFFDYVKRKDYVFFTIIYSNEDGYDAYYHFTYDLKKDQLTDVTRIAIVGGDGGYSQHETLLYSHAFTRLHVKTKEMYDEFLDHERYENCFSRTTDVYDTKFHFEGANTTMRKENTKTSCDTICE